MDNTTDGVSVFCRLKPLNDENIKPCIQFEDEFTVCTVPPEGCRRNTKEMKYSFTKVFNEHASQAEVFNDVTFPLVNDLLNNKNGLQFAYGVTGSGKTYTMEGTEESPGIVGRTIKSLFRRLNFIKRFRIRPDERNGYKTYNEIDAMFAIDSNRRKYSKRSGDHYCVMYMDKIDDDPFEVKKVDNCTVFISMVEIYGNNIKDLLAGKNENLEVTIKEDKKLNKYLHNVREIEVQSESEAIFWFRKGQKKRRIAETNLNNQSSRSHCIFNMRLVKLNEHISTMISEYLSVSQLSLIDLAGSERAKRTGASGAQLKEAGDINNSLMELQSIMNKLRDKQKHSTKVHINYRSNTLTHLLKTSFESNCKVRMIVCVQQRPEEYDETLNVLSFAEDAKEIRIIRNDNLMTLRGRKIPLKVNNVIKNEVTIENDEIDYDKLNEQLDKHLESVKQYRNIGPNEIEDKLEMCKSIIEIYNILGKIQNIQSIIMTARKKLYEQLEIDDEQIEQAIMEKDADISRLKQMLKQKDQRIEKLSIEYLSNKSRKSLRSNPEASVKEITKKFESQKDLVSKPINKPIFIPSKKVTYYNPYYKHNKINYLVHKEKNEVPCGSLNKLNVKKSIVSSTVKLKDLGKSSKYLLQRQTESDCEFQTNYIEGNVTPTAGGGYVVELTGIETVKQSLYNNVLNGRKRRSSCSDINDSKKHKLDLNKNVK